jgi:flagellar L-ring protein precursor FlgH
MRLKISLLLGAIIGGIATAGPARAQSLWDRRDPYSAYLFVDNRARHVGDLVTIVVLESTDLINQEVRNLEKKTNNQSILSWAGKIVGGHMQRSGSLDLSHTVSSDRKLDGTANFTADRKFLDRITATVVAVQPNGNLVIQGLRKRHMTGEERTLIVQGVIRPIDIASDNTIQSQSIAEFKVFYEGKGQESAFSSQGWLARIANHLWPF